MTDVTRHGNRPKQTGPKSKEKGAAKRTIVILEAVEIHSSGERLSKRLNVKVPNVDITYCMQLFGIRPCKTLFLVKTKQKCTAHQT